MLSTPFVGTAPQRQGTLSSLGSPPARRGDATSLRQWMEREIDKLRTDEARQGTSETHVLKAARAIYSVAFREVTRQVTITCAEWGALLSKIFAVHSDLLDGMLAERERWKLAEAAAWVTQQQAAHATKLRTQVARMLLSTQQVLATQEDHGLRSAADDATARRDEFAADSGIGGMGDLFAATDVLRQQDGGLSSPAEGSGQGDEQARLARTLQLAASLERKGAETLLRTLMDDDGGALPSVGSETRLLAADTLVSSLDTAQRVPWLCAHAQRLPPPDEHQLLIALLRDMGVSRWASLLAEVLVELPVQQLSPVLAPPLILMTQDAWLELLQEMPDASQLHVLESLLQMQQAERWVPLVRARLHSLPPSVGDKLRAEVDGGVSYATDLWREGAEAQVGMERAASELAKRLMEAESRATAAEARVKYLEAGGSNTSSKSGSRSGSLSGSRAPSRAGEGPPGKDPKEGAGVGAGLSLRADGAVAAGELPGAEDVRDEVETTFDARDVTHINTHTPCLCIFDVSASALPCSGSGAGGGKKTSDADSCPYLVFTLLETGVSAKTRTLRNATTAYWHGDLLRLRLPRDAAPPFRCRVQLFEEDWEDHDDVLGTSKETQLNGNGTNSVNFLELSQGTVNSATVNFSYRWVDAVSGPVVLA